MSLIPLIGNRNEDIGWSLILDSGDNNNEFDATDTQGVLMACTSTHVAISAATTAGQLGRTYECQYVASVDMDGTLNYEKLIASSTDGINMRTQSGALNNLIDNPNEADHLILSVNASSDAKIVHINDTGGIDDLVDPAFGGGNERIACLSNGDVWATMGPSNPPTLILLDESAVNEYETILQNISVDGANITNRHYYPMGVDSSDNLYLVNVVDSSQKVGIFKINSSGTITAATKFYKFADTGDNVTAYNGVISSSGDVYVVWRNYDSSATTYYYMLSKFNSSLTHQWTVKYSTTTLSSSKGSGAISPTGDYVYLTADGKLYIHDTSTGELVSHINVSGEGLTIADVSVTANSTHSFLGGLAYSGAFSNGVALLKLEPTAFEAGGVYGDWDLRNNGTTTTSTETITTEAGTTTTSAGGLSVTTVTDVSSVALDAAFNSTLTTVSIQ